MHFYRTSHLVLAYCSNAYNRDVAIDADSKINLRAGNVNASLCPIILSDSRVHSRRLLRGENEQIVADKLYGRLVL